eukprot:gene5873-6315_t
MFHSQIHLNNNRRFSYNPRYDRKRQASLPPDNPLEPSSQPPSPRDRAKTIPDQREGDEENQIDRRRHPNRIVRKSDFQTVLEDLRGYLNNDRDNIILTIDTSEDDSGRHHILGHTVAETINMHSGWLSRLLRFLSFYVVGVVFYSNYEGWSFQDCVYFITQTVTTLGYGNITPTSRGARVFTIFYIYTGILVAFSLLSEISGNLVLFMRSKYKKPMKLNKFQVFVRNVYNCMMWIIILAVIPLFGSLVFKENEGWSDSEAMYFSVITATSVGYGDLLLSKSSSIWFNIFYILVSVALTALALEKISGFKRHLDQQELWQVLDDIHLSKALIDAVNSKDGKVTSAEYVLHMLQLEGKLNYSDDIIRWKRRFEEFDIDKDGFLTLDDVESYNHGMRRQTLVDDLLSSSSKPPADSADEVSSDEAKVVDLAGQPIVPKKRSILMQFTEESKDIFLETIGMKEPPSYHRKTAEPSQLEEVTSNPMVRAKALRRASNVSRDSTSTNSMNLGNGVDKENVRPRRPKRHTTLGLTGYITDSGVFPKIEMVGKMTSLDGDEGEGGSDADRLVVRRPFAFPPRRTINPDATASTSQRSEGSDEVVEEEQRETSRENENHPAPLIQRAEEKEEVMPDN